MQETFDRDLIILLHELAHSLRIQADRAARAHGMTRAQWIILARLARQPGISQNEMASICEVEPITVGRLVDRLEARGLVERCPDPADRRVRRLKLLPAARPLVDEITAYRAELNAELTDGLTDREREDLTDTLLRIKNNMAADGANCPKRQSAGG
jgi:MarR family transcriptional regulator for hemolysin